MRIDAYNQVAKIYKTSKSSQTKSAQSVAQGRDEVQISSFGRDFQIAKQAVAEASDIREDKVAELRTRVRSGNYRVDSGDFAGRLLERYHAAQF